mgnify:CR=1 FL=1
MTKPRETTFQIRQLEFYEFGEYEMIDAEILFITSLQEDLPSRFDPSLVESVRKFIRDCNFTALNKQVEVIPTHGLARVPYLLLVSVGGDPLDSIDRWREAAALAMKTVKRLNLHKLVVGLPESLILGSGLASHVIINELTEGFLLGNYEIHSYQQVKKPMNSLKEINFVVDSLDEPGKLEMERHIGKAQVYSEATNYARDLTNLPGNLLTPEALAEEAGKLAERFGFEIIVYNEQEIIEQGMYGLHHVGKGSMHPPRMIVMKYQGLENWTDVLGLVGKGITFDTGGISLKKPEGMEEMVSDMGGAAVLLGVMQALGELRPKVNIVVVLPAAENMPSGNAYKPGDIIPTLSGKTIEVLNTDAEGRIVLADGITLAKQLGAQKIIDVATLTGAILVSLGDVATGAITNDDLFLRELLTAAERSGEKLWQLPAYPEYKEMLKSDVADVKNATTGRLAGAITAGLFIGLFAEKTPWIHLDTGGTAWLWHERGIHPKGGTGAMVRTLIRMICTEQ